MPIPAGEIIARTSIVLQDEEHVRWPLEELFLWLNDAASEIVIRRPAAGAKTEVITLDDGPLQTLPAESIQLLDITRNIPGRSISRVMRRLLDAQTPDWYDMRTTAKIKHYTLEDVNPTQFYVYPPAKAGTQVEAMFSIAPPTVSDLTDDVMLDRAYIGPLVSYILYRAMAKDSEYANGAVAASHFQAFNEALMAQNTVSSLETGKAGSA